MKKNGLMLVFLLIIVGIIAVCYVGKENLSTDHSSAKSSTKSSQSTKSKASSSSASASKPESSSASQSDTIRTSEVQGSDLTKARQALYLAGYNSYEISDETLLVYWREAKEKHLDFVTYVKSRQDN